MSSMTPAAASPAPAPMTASPDRRVGLTAWAVVVGVLLLLFGVVPELVVDHDASLAAAPVESVAQGLRSSAAP